jgi:hypothetical protein
MAKSKATPKAPNGGLHKNANGTHSNGSGHGTFKTEGEARKQQEAMYANNPAAAKAGHFPKRKK